MLQLCKRRGRNSCERLVLHGEHRFSSTPSDGGTHCAAETVVEHEVYRRNTRSSTQQSAVKIMVLTNTIPPK